MCDLLRNKLFSQIILERVHHLLDFIECALHDLAQAPEKIEVLQEPAIILLIYEEAISRLHPPCRRLHDKTGLAGPRGNCESNRLCRVLPYGASMPHRTSKEMDNLDRKLSGLKSQYSNINELREWVRRDCTSCDELVLAMNSPKAAEPHRFGTRNRTVNFTTAANNGEEAERQERERNGATGVVTRGVGQMGDEWGPLMVRYVETSLGGYRETIGH